MIASEGRAEVNALEKEKLVDFDGSGDNEGEYSLGTFTGGAEATKSTGVGDIIIAPSPELRSEVVDEPIVEVFATQVDVTGGSLDLDDIDLDGNKGDIESPSTEVEDEDLTLTG